MTKPESACACSPNQLESYSVKWRSGEVMQQCAGQLAGFTVPSGVERIRSIIN